MWEDNTVLKYYTFCTDKDNHDPLSLDKLILDKIGNVLYEFGLSKFGKEVALSWIAKATTDSSGECDRARLWILNKLNQQVIPKGISTWQKGCPEIIPGLRSCPVWNTSEFPWIETLERSYESICKELLSLKGKKGFQQYRAPSWTSDVKANNNIGNLSHEGGDWNVYYLYLHNLDFSENRKACPITIQFLNEIEANYDHAFFSALAPKTHVKKHHGPTNKKLRCQFPLVVPDDKCYLRVGNERVKLSKGKCIIFDDSFEHEAWNHDENLSRIVLIFDVWHPDISLQERKFFSFLRNSALRLEKKLSVDDHDNFYSIIKTTYHEETNHTAIWS